MASPGKSPGKSRPFYFKDDDSAESEAGNSVYENSPDPTPSKSPLHSTQDQTDISTQKLQQEWEDNETKFWPASSQIAFSQKDENTVSGFYLDESGELKPSSGTAIFTGPTDEAPKDYAGYARMQSEQTRMAMKGFGDADAYLQLPQSKLRTPSLTGPVLSSARHPLNRQEDLAPKDTFFKYAYLSNMGFMLFIGLLITLIFPSDVRDGILKSPTLYRVIIESAKAFTSVISFSIIVTMAWVYFMERYTETIVYGMIGFIPVSCLTISLWGIIEFFHKDSGSALGHAYLYILTLGGFIGALLSAWLIHRSKETIKTTTNLAKTAAKILSQNPSVYFASFLLLLAYMLFVTIWIGMFAHVMLLGHVEEIKKPELIKEWRFSTWSYIFQAYFLFMLVWTTSVFSNLQKAMISGVVSKWYFYHENPDYQSSQSPAFEALQEAATRYFGQICLGGLVVAGVKSARLSFWAYRKGTSRIQTRWAQAGLSSINSVMTFVEKLVEHVTDFAVYYVALSGESFCKSGRSVVRTFKRNALLGATTDLISRMIFSISTFLVSVLTGLTSYVFTSHVLKSQYGWVSAILFGLLSWYILQIFADIYSDTLDVMFLCYAIDRDTDKVHSPEVHGAYAHHEQDQIIA